MSAGWRPAHGQHTASLLWRLEQAELTAANARVRAQRRVDRLMRERPGKPADLVARSRWLVRLQEARVALHNAFAVHHAAMRRNVTTILRLYKLRVERHGGQS